LSAFEEGKMPILSLANIAGYGFTIVIEMYHILNQMITYFSICNIFLYVTFFEKKTKNFVIFAYIFLKILSQWIKGR